MLRVAGSGGAERGGLVSAAACLRAVGIAFLGNVGPHVACGKQCAQVLHWASRLQLGQPVWRAQATGLSAGQMVSSGV